MRLIIIGKMDSRVVLASDIATSHGATVVHSTSVEGAISSLCSGKGADVALIDVSFDVKSFINALVRERVNIPVIGYGIETNSAAAVNAIKAGAKEYIPFPPDKEMIAAILESIADNSTSVIFSSDVMKNVITMADRVAPSNANILVTGESGTGKEVIARYIHKKSKRSVKNFVSINCAAIPENLLESELFGHEKGAFTGAQNKRIGKFEESSGGTLLLDEISEMDIRLQAKLLRAIQEGEIDRVGGTKPVKVDLRIIATSNRDLQKEVRNGTFREDLLFRLNVIHLKLPALRERKEDIKLFADYFAKKYAESNGLPVRLVSAVAMKKLESHNWRGNVRELENTIHRAVLLATGKELDKSSIIIEESSVSEENSGKLVGRTVDSVEQELIENTLKHCLGNRTNAATILGISIRTLRNKLNQYNDDIS